MTTNEVLGIAGFVVALLALILSITHVCWQVWWQRHQNKERVKAAVSLGPNPCVRVHNVGVIPVFVTGVELVVEADGKTSDYPFQPPLIHKACAQGPDGLAIEHWQLMGDRAYKEPLQRGNAYIFALPQGGVPLNEIVANPDKFRIHISVHSNAGELCRIKKTEALAYLAALARQVSSVAS